MDPARPALLAVLAAGAGSDRGPRRRDRARLAVATDGDRDHHLAGAHARDHGSLVPAAARRPAGDPAEGAARARRAAGAGDALARGLRPQLGAEAVDERLHDLLAQRGGVLVGERALGRLVHDPERDRLAPRPDLLAAVDVERPHLAQLRTGGLARRLDELAGGDLLGHRERQVLPERRIADHVLVDEPLRDAREQRRQVELEHAPPPLEPLRMELAHPAAVEAGRLARVEEPLPRAVEARLDL